MNLPPELEDEIITILEAALVALEDESIFSYIAYNLDTSHNHLSEVRNSIDTYLNRKD
jgi:hypothetical protein